MTRHRPFLAFAFLTLLASALPSPAAQWIVWPPNGHFQCHTVSHPQNGETITVFNSLEGAGHARQRLTIPDGHAVQTISFQARTRPQATKRNQEVMLEESSGERFFKNITLTNDWNTFVIKATHLSLYTYGNATIQNGTLDQNQIRFIRFNCFPKGGICELKNLKLSYQPIPNKPHQHITKKSPTPQQTFALDKIALTPPKAPQAVPDLRRITVRNANFIRDGKPYFMLGGWQLDQEGPPWIMRALDVDVTVYNADEIYTLLNGQRQPDGRIKVRWEPNPWYPAIITRFLQNNLLFWHEHKGHPQYNALKKFPEFKAFHGAGHFVPYDPFQKIGVDCYLEMFKSWMRYTRDFPIFAYELFNEMIYDNPHLVSRQAFQVAMRRKFHDDINTANQAWNTSFTSFQDVQPPGFLTDAGQNDRLPRELLKQREARQFPNLYVDWQKFQEQRCYEAVKMLMPKMRQFDPDPQKLQTLQSHMQFRTDFANCGIKPETLVDFSDFYSHECGAAIIDSGKRQGLSHLLTMLKSMFAADLVKSINPHKPSFDAEAPIGIKTVGASEATLRDTDLADLSSSWKFYDASNGTPADWHDVHADETTWKTIRVPAMWGKEGFPKCTVGIYRKHFKINDLEKIIAARKKLFFNGQGFADTAELWLNGTKLGTVSGFDRKFTFDITSLLREQNVIVAKIRNTFFSDGMYFGGIRGFASVNDDVLVPKDQQGLQPHHLRSVFWSMAIHGLSGLMFSYEANLFSPAAKALPQIKAQINSAAPIIYDAKAMPKPQIALIYPLETFRGIIHQDYLQKLQGPATIDLMKWYAPLVFSHRGLHILRNQNLDADALKSIRLLAMTQNIRASQKAMATVKNYVRQGGNLLLDVNCLTKDDDTHQPQTIQDLCGFTEIQLNRHSRTSQQWGPIVPRFIDTFSYASIRTAPHTKVLARLEDGTPLLTMAPYGSGKVFCLTANLPPQQTQSLIQDVIRQTTEAPGLQLKPLEPNRPTPYAVDARLYNQDQQRFLLYLLNWGKSGVAKAALTDLPAGNYIIRNLETGNVIKAPAGKTWTAERLRHGLPVKLNTFSPVTLLIETDGIAPMTIRGISPQRRAILDELWSEKPLNPALPTVAIAGIFGGTTRENHGTIPTAAKLLTDNGFNVINFNNRKTDLKRIKVLVWQQQRLKMEEPQKVLDFVRDGGGLLLCGNAILTYHNKGNNTQFLKQLGLDMGQPRQTILYNQTPHTEDILRNCCMDFASHPIASHVTTFVTAGSGFLETLPPNATVILKAPKTTNAPGKTLLAAMTYGKGKIVWLSDHWCLRPFNLEQGDNAQLWFNIISYLADRPIRQLTEQQKDKALFITAQKLKQAEQQEKQGCYDLTPVNCYPSSLLPTRPEDIIGIGGGDPIVDQFK